MVKEKHTFAEKFCRCIKQVRKTVKARKGSKESAAIGICVQSVLQTRGKTLKRFTCRKPKRATLTTQSIN